MAFQDCVALDDFFADFWDTPKLWHMIIISIYSEVFSLVFYLLKPLEKRKIPELLDDFGRFSS